MSPAKRFINDLLSIAPAEFDLRPGAEAKLEIIFDALKNKKRAQALKLRYVQGLSWPVLAGHMGVPTSEAQSLVLNGLALLRGQMRSISTLYKAKSAAIETKAPRLGAAALPAQA